ncbi:helix-turn-helix transcriptional regulator [Simiduia agarivorans]|uniref:Transcriptional regulator n=1 Tax=Simiduia agarivorans (strain DSM 21679 / JCM 13881 / BCRC 17597 / SA1) TaxID=1117647 RepID=K4KPX5_SIMAS|nr:YafY family protein [Simiduia agarivorans]AFV00149.1 putative transcriptional regulator [Simiduia agarivorans SA1 = DSM 21679]
MHKSERLFELVNILRSRHTAISAAQLAEHFKVSERTVYRDIQSLQLSGVAIEGEAGVGYALRRDAHIPPLQFSRDELEALLLGARMAQGWSDAAMARNAESAITKILAALPAALKSTDQELALRVPRFESNALFTQFSEEFRRAIKSHQVVLIDYRDVAGAISQRRIEPLGLLFWGATWTLVAFCQLRNAYRCFRLDRISAIHITDEHFATHPGKNLQHCLLLMESEDIAHNARQSTGH